MKKIGRQVHFIPASQNNSRNGEGSFIRLSDGSLLFAYTSFFSNGREDEDVAQISYIKSTDDGESWTDEGVLFAKPQNAVNIMSFSFLKMLNGDIGAFYILKNPDGTDDIIFRRSEDDCKTWSEPVSCIKNVLRDDYYILNNDRVEKLSNGRVILPLACHSLHVGCEGLTPGEIYFVYSDDDCKTFKKSEEKITCPFPHDPIGLQEPGIYEKGNGVLWCYIRTCLGFQYQSFSEDFGETWSPPCPNTFFSSPGSPMSVKNCKNIAIAIFNPIPEHVLRDEDKEFWGRTPYVMAVSYDKGETFLKENLYYIEDDLSNGYCYPAVTECENGFLVSYYHSNNTDCCLNSTKIIKINYNELV